MLTIKQDNLTKNQVIALLNEHLADMHATSPPESIHALNLAELKANDVKFWTIWQDDALAGCGGYKKLNNIHAEIKSMRTAASFKHQGIASTLLKHIITQARLNGFQKLSLETGTMDFFKPAHRLYEKHGFTFCAPFSNYVDDPNSKFMTLSLL